MKLLIISILILALAELVSGHRKKVPVWEKEEHITSGSTAIMGQFPYQVGLSILFNSTIGYWCGGSLIDKKWILTAAHCLDLQQTAIVMLGTTDLSRPKINLIVHSRNFIIHSDYNRNSIENDIALIKIPPVKYSTEIQPIRLPSIRNKNMKYIGVYANATGWGLTSDISRIVSRTLQWAPLQIIENSECVKYYGPYILDTNICVSTQGGVSTCLGDSGGPLVVGWVRPTLIGLTSAGAKEGCTKGYPVIFTRVSSYLDWIRKNTGIS